MAEQEGYIEVRPFTGEQIYLPIWEEKSVPLEVQLGCSWHQCRFCDFANDPRHVFSLAEVAAKAEMLAPYMKGRPRVFLLGENALTLPIDHLRGIMEKLDHIQSLGVTNAVCTLPVFRRIETESA